MIDRTNITVRYAETDRMGVVYYANYLVWFEVGRTSYLKKTGLSYKEIEDKFQCFFMVRDVKCTYLASATYDDNVIIESEVQTIKNSTLIFKQRAILNDKTITEALVTLVCVRDGKALRIPDQIRALIPKD